MEPATRVEIRDNTDNREKEGLWNISIILGPGDLEIVTDVEGETGASLSGKNFWNAVNVIPLDKDNSAQ